MQLYLTDTLNSAILFITYLREHRNSHQNHCHTDRQLECTKHTICDSACAINMKLVKLSPQLTWPILNQVH